VLTIGILATAVSFGGGLGLLPTETPTPPPASPGHTSTPAPPSGPKPSMPASSLAAIALAGAAVLSHSNRRGRSGIPEPAPGDALGLRPPPDVRVVFVPGHNDPQAATVFQRLVDFAGIDPGNVRWFDYRWITGIDDHRLASRLVPVDVAAMSLNSFLAGVAAGGHPVYVVGFSKGGAAMAHLIAEWDRGLPGPSDAVVGAALLEPPIASGVTGLLQSIGRFWGAIPDDGGYDPLRCTVLRVVCTDTRVGLGGVSGVEVIIIQNPKAGVTNVGVPPPGLRVVQAPDDGPGILQQIIRNPVLLPSRISDAHKAVLRDPKVADCIVAEMWSPGSCGLAPAAASTSSIGVTKPPLWALLQ
jgi:hypothetical protein